MSTSVSESIDRRLRWRPLPPADVKIGGFLGGWVRKVAEASLPAGLESPLRDRFRALSRGEDPGPEEKLASDSDLFKWMEGAACALGAGLADSRLRDELERTVELVAAAQRDDGFLTSRTGREAAPFTQRNHDLYTCGHYLEAAVAHFSATGSRRMLEGACRFADFYIREWQDGNPYYATAGEREHPEIELGLVRLYRATGGRKYLDFAAAVTDMATLAGRVGDLGVGGGGTHCVRVGYYLAACAEIFAETGEEKYLAPLAGLWEEIAETLTYVTGGVGTGEKFPRAPFVLPQRGDIAETCASIAMAMWGRRMHGLTGETRYFDAVETALYNNVLGALSLDALAVYYYQPLLVPKGDETGRHRPGGSRGRIRLPQLHRTSCCFPNIWRFLPSLGEYLFSVSDSGLSVNLYSASEARFTAPGGVGTRLAVETGYPHEGTVEVAVDPERPADFELRLRIPSWCAGAAARVNGDVIPCPPPGEYLVIGRSWRAGDRVELSLPMRAEALSSRPEVVDNLGQVAFRRGPLVYCLEDLDAGGLDIDRVALVSRDTTETWEPGLLGGVHVLSVRAAELSPAGGLYARAGALRAGGAREVRLVPFYARANRSDDPRWRVWLPED